MLSCIKNILQLHDSRYFVFSLRNKFLVSSYIEICRQEVFGLSLSTLSSCSFKEKRKTRIRICILYHLRGWYFNSKFRNSFIYTYRFFSQFGKEEIIQFSSCTFLGTTILLHHVFREWNGAQMCLSIYIQRSSI